MSERFETKRYIKAPYKFSSFPFLFSTSAKNVIHFSRKKTAAEPSWNHQPGIELTCV